MGVVLQLLMLSFCFHFLWCLIAGYIGIGNGFLCSLSIISVITSIFFLYISLNHNLMWILWHFFCISRSFFKSFIVFEIVRTLVQFVSSMSSFPLIFVAFPVRWCLFFGFFYSAKTNLLTSSNITKVNLLSICSI